MANPSVISFSIQGGETDPREPYLRIWENREDDLGALYGIVEVVSGPPRDVASIVWQGVEEALKGSRKLTLTRYLQNALDRGHQYLGEYAARGWRAGVTLASLRDDDLYMVWAGPSLVYLMADGELLRPGNQSKEVLGTGVALGEPGDLTPHVAHETVAEGDIFLMAWTRLENTVTEPTLAALLATGLENSSQTLFRLASSQVDFAVLLAGFEPLSAAPPPVS